MTRVVTGSRLHFGLFRLPPDGPWAAGERYFGGVGMMVDRPGVRIAVTPADEWSSSGPLGPRALACAQRCAAHRDDLARPHRVIVESCAPEHAGLGTGTQLELAVAAALAASNGIDPLPAEELARLTGRGRRSAIGVHGFAHGGFLVDGGKRRPESLAPLVARGDFPREWRVVLLTPRAESTWHGVREEAAVAAARGWSDDALCRLTLIGLLPALGDRDLRAFGEALFEFNLKAGVPFRAAQGGAYAGAATQDLVDWLRSRGVRGAAQSSWGPTVAAVVGDADQAVALVDAARRERPTVAVVVTSAMAGGAVTSACER